VTELAEAGDGGEVIMRIAGHVSGTMLSRYSTSEWKRSGRPSIKLPLASVRRMRKAERKPRGSMRFRPDDRRQWSSNLLGSGDERGYTNSSACHKPG